MPTLIEQLAYGAVRGALAAWAEVGPQLVESTVKAWRRAMTDTMVDAGQAPTDIVAGVGKEITDATK